MEKRRTAQVAIAAVVVVVVILLVLAYVIFFGASSSTTQLPVDTWVRLERVQPPIYVKYVGLMTGDQPSFGFVSAEQPSDEMTSASVTKDEKYSFGDGGVGEVVILGCRTTYFDAYENPESTSVEEYVRFRVVSYDAASDTVSIRVLPPSKQGQ